MKKLLLFTLILLMNLASDAHYKQCMLRIREDRGRTISVTIDGRRYNKISRTLTVGDLPAGRHSLKIFAYNSNGYGYRNGRLIYSGNITTRPGGIYYCSVERGDLEVEENCCIDDYGRWNQDDNWENWDEDNHCWNNNQNWRNNDAPRHEDDYYNSWNNRNDNDDWRKRNNERTDDDYNDRNWNNYSGVMSNGGYNQLLDQIRKASFESSKVSAAKTGLKGNKITVNQLIGILNEFTFESTKLDFAKSSYRMVVDRRNYILVNDVFTFQSSKDDLNDFLQKQN